MTDKPYTDADVDDLHETFAKAWSLHLSQHPAPPCNPEMNTEDCCDRSGLRAVLDALTAAGRLAPADDDPRHVIQFRADGWTIKHPLACRLGDLFGCAVNQAAEDLDGPPVPPGRYVVTVDGIDGRLRVGESVDEQAVAPAAGAPTGTCPCTCHQPDRCPCKPGTPQHRHGAGGYCTVGNPVPADERPTREHVIAFAADGTWTLEHPATCRPAAVSRVPREDPTYWDCAVRRLAERQVTSDLTPLVAGGRYTCSVGTLGDVFLLGDRLHDDQCTAPVCAACGCWCHAEEQTPAAPDHDHTSGLPTFAPDAELCVNTSTGAEMWTGARWNEHVTAATKHQRIVPQRLIQCPPSTCTTTCPANPDRTEA
ncbi:DUF6085 family protein [Micromonospora sp. NPDC023633]|uniref:DUF6085 family protein n=1 Tax=Micromonospora sp. NPDC023633 TaxID=3154320 RepID=UPI0034008A49